MKTKRVLLNIALLVVAAFASASTTKADPLLFSNATALQDAGFSTVSLSAGQGLTLYGPQISFKVDVTGALPPMGTDTLRITYVEQGSAPIIQDIPIPFFGTDPPFTVLFTINSPGATIQGIPASLTFDLLNSSPDFIIPFGPNAGQHVDSFTFSFNVATAVPEPASLTLAALGITFGLGLIRRKS